MKKIILLVLVLLLLHYIVGYCIEDKVVAIVNDEAITMAELNSYINLVKLQIGNEGWNKYNMTDTKALEGLIEDKLLLQEAKKSKIEIPERMIEQRLKDIRSKFNSEEDFLDFFIQRGFSETLLKENIKEQLVTDKLITMQIRNRIFISPTEITDFYKEHIQDFHQPESAQVDCICVQENELAKEIFTKLKQGADFTELRNQYSMRANLGRVSKGQLRKELEDIIFNLKIGESSQPIETSDGYYLFLVRNKFPSKERSLVQVQDQIRNILMEKKFNEKLKQFIEKLKNKSYIVIKSE